MPEPLIYDIAQTRAAMGDLGRSTIYRLIASGDLQVVKIGRRSFITRESVENYVQRLAGGGALAASAAQCDSNPAA